MKLRELYSSGCEKLNSAGIEEAELDSRLLLLHAFSLTTAEYLLNQNKDIDEYFSNGEECRSKYEKYIEERSLRRPLQYILSGTEFMGLQMYCEEGVLIPRQDTETLCEEVLNNNKNAELSVLDMCTGSGCIASALSYYGLYKDIMAADISDKAIEVAGINLTKHAKNGFRLIQSDLFEAFKDENNKPLKKFDIIVSNPPYIKTSVIAELDPEVREYEPKLALDGDEDGLKFYKRISTEARDFLFSGGKLYYEIGYDQGEKLCHILKELGYTDIEVIKDLRGLDRVVSASFY
ncbi:MAG: peptide chain release factor N(5)-glutamine methyltransferase [Eubacteriales bacterium]|nr:peptide chain release factor N(5)-glutamine methyltransferase [Eubacteriales bacterium]